MHCVVQIVIGGFFRDPAGDIKAMQIASLSQRCVCHKWVCDIGIVKPFTSNEDNEGMPSQGLGVAVNSELDLIPAQKGDWH